MRDPKVPLERSADAHRLNEEGRGRGEVVVTVDRDAEHAAGTVGGG